MSIDDDLVAEIGDGSITGCLRRWPECQTFGRYAMTDEGLTANIKGSGNKAVAETVRIARPFEVLGYCRDPDGRGWGKSIRFYDADGGVHTCHVAETTLHGDVRALAGRLAQEGLHIERRYHEVFAEYLNSVEPPGRVTLVKRTGWHEVGGELVFVLPEEPIGGERLGETILFEGGTSWV